MHDKQIKAIELAIKALVRERRRLYAAGETAYRQGVRIDHLDKDGVVGELFVFVEDSHQSYAEYTDAIQELEDLIEILEDSGVTLEQPELMP